MFQDFNLLDTFNIRDNIFSPLVLAGKSYDEMSANSSPSPPAPLGIGDILDKFPYEVSGGRQRAAVARALMASPA